MRFEVWHVSGQLHGIDVMHAKFLKSRRVNQTRRSRCIDPMPSGRRRGVPPRVQGVRDFTCCHIGIGDQLVDQRTFARARGAKNQSGFVGEAFR